MAQAWSVAEVLRCKLLVEQSGRKAAQVEMQLAADGCQTMCLKGFLLSLR
ncbi:MAG: hypothetical protein JWQ42_1141 [Edaphobacter sp.]|nr:hypothetical protein [Edaphobacter sp.]